MTRWIAAALAGLCCMSSATTLAHHSGAMFDYSRTITLQGTVKSFMYMNPHAWISIIGSPDGKGPDLQWDIETVSPSSLQRIGISRETFKAGEKVTVIVNPLRDGRRAGSFLSVTFEDGRRFGVDPSQLELPAAERRQP
jgi:hypothetical protein